MKYNILKIATCIVVIFFLLQTTNATNITNGYLFSIYSPVINGTEDTRYKFNDDLYHIDVEVLSQPLVKIYKKNKQYSSIVEKIKERGFEAEVYNYLNFEEGETMKYPFHITQTFTVKNKENRDITLESSYFPLKGAQQYNSYPRKFSNNVYIAERYGIIFPTLNVDGKYIPLNNNYKIYRSDSDVRFDLEKGRHFTIQQEWNSKISIKAGETVKVSFSFYATNVPNINDKLASAPDGGYYKFAGVSLLESLPEEMNHTIHIPEGMSVMKNSNELLEGPYTDDIFLNSGETIQIVE